MRKSVLLTNDDGVDAAFMHVLAEALQVHCDVTVVAPADEQSWIGRAMSRRSELTLRCIAQFPYPCFALSGSPTDCVNVALTHLLSKAPDLVVSGMNIGYNASVPLIYSSGTVAGATEGAFWDLPAVAISQAVLDTVYESAVANKAELPEPMADLIRRNAQHAAQFALALSAQPSDGSASVHNLNYPPVYKAERSVRTTRPARLSHMALYERVDEDRFVFRFQHGTERPSEGLTDRQCLLEGDISYTILNFSALGID